LNATPTALTPTYRERGGTTALTLTLTLTLSQSNIMH